MADTITITDTSLLRLMQLSSASLPVGGYSFSQGLEYAIEAGWLLERKQLADWLTLVMETSLVSVDLPLLKRCYQTIDQQQFEMLDLWNATVIASRETHELQLTETAMGDALKRLLKSLEITLPSLTQPFTFLTGFALAAHHWQVSQQAMMVGYVWSWLENQIAAATKLVPLGQTEAQQLLISLSSDIENLVQQSMVIEDGDIGASLPGLAMASSWHETQYSRLFRS